MEFLYRNSLTCEHELPALNAEILWAVSSAGVTYHTSVELPWNTPKLHLTFSAQT